VADLQRGLAIIVDNYVGERSGDEVAFPVLADEQEN
jgi:hypothetical protein